MEKPSPRRGPPPPSIPPPENISRSGRVPPPRGAPPPGVRRARLPGRRPKAQEPTVRVEGAGRQDAGRRGKEDGIDRRVDPGRRSSSEEGRASRGSSRESLGDRTESGREEHPLPAVSRRRRSDSPHSTSIGDRREDSADAIASESDTSTANARREVGERRHDESNRRTRTGYEREFLRPSSSGASDDDAVGGKEIKRRETRGRDESNERTKGGGRNPKTAWGKHRDEDRRSKGRPHRRGRTNSDLYSESDEEGARAVKNENHKEHRLQGEKAHSRSSTQRAGNSRNLEREGFFPSGSDGSGTDRAQLADPHTSRDSSPRTRRRRKNDQNQSSRNDGRNEDRARRRRGTEDDSEGEDYGWRRSKHSWDTGGSPNAHYRSDRSDSPASTRKGDDASHRKPAAHQEIESADDGSQTVGVTEGARRSTTGAAEGNKELSSPMVREHGKENKSISESEGSPAKRSAKSVAGRASSPRSPSLGTGRPLFGKPADGATVGKPIRGARWGEAIGVRSKVLDATTIPTGIWDLKRFVCFPLRCGPGTVARCFIERNRSGTHKFSHMFSMYADLEDGNGRLLLAARKLFASKTAHYIICTRQDDLFRSSGRRGGCSFLGKLRATTAAHTEYALYDGGDNPDSVPPEMKTDTSSDTESKSKEADPEIATAEALARENAADGELRRELGVIVFNFDKKEQRTGKRRMEVAIPQLQEQGDPREPVSWQPSEAKESMIPSFGRIRYQGAQNLMLDDRLLVFHQRESRYDPLSSCLVDFRGRATAPSVKNFQLIWSPPEDNLKRARFYSEGAGKDDRESDDLPRPVYLQMGKVGKDCFNVDVEWPLSLLQAFAICLSRFDTNAQF